MSRARTSRSPGLEQIDKVIRIDQTPIGRTPRSNPATYTGLFSPIRDLYAMLPESRERGYKPGRFSFNVKGGRCEACQGDGLKRIEMNFLPDVYVTCDVCRGKRYNHETLQVKYKGYSIAELLELTVEEALPVLENHPQIRPKLQTLLDVGLGYIHLGQSSTTLSGGEAQRIKLAKELSKRQTGKTFYVLDEPTTGLHFDDVRKLLDVLQRLTDLGNTVVVIEHNLDVIKTADWVIDLGPDGGEYGGRVVASGTPEQLLRSKKSFTAEALEKYWGRDRRRPGHVDAQPLSIPAEDLRRTVSLAQRGGKVKVADFAQAYRRGSGIQGLIGSLPRILAGEDFRAVVTPFSGSHPTAAESSGAWAATSSNAGWRPCCRTDAPRLRDRVCDERVGVHPRFRDCARRTHQRRCRSRVARRQLRLGRRDRARNEPASADDARRWDGIGARRDRWGARCRRSQLTVCCYNAYRQATPVTVHVAIGTDTPHTHPAADGAAIGEASRAISDCSARWSPD